MHDSLLNFFMCLIVIVALIVMAWATSAASIALDCERLGGFYSHNNTYKCELVSKGN
ncbi:MAG: hypothetical protein JHC33_09690 [Ignisphaera sp.]|nr:hypothetical protein [Ignisphaera sp.]